MSATPDFLDSSRPDVPDIVVPPGVVPFHLPGRPVRGRLVRLGGLVEAGSVRKLPDGDVRFGVADHAAADEVVYHGDLPDLFREGQGVVTQGVFRPDGVFEAREVLAKHDERYMPKEVADALKRSGEWRGD